MLSENPSCGYAVAFASGLTDPSIKAPEDLVAASGKRVVKRYNVYRNNVTVSLIDALAAVYPAIQRITGVGFFRAMARFHVRATLPTSPLLFEYGQGFPAFIETYEYAREMPWLADTARIERAWLDAYHAVSIFAMNRTDGPITPFRSSEAEDALVTRPGQEVLVSRLPEGGAAFLSHLLESASLGDAVAAALHEAPSFDIQANLAGMLSAGAFTGVHVQHGD